MVAFKYMPLKEILSGFHTVEGSAWLALEILTNEQLIAFKQIEI